VNYSEKRARARADCKARLLESLREAEAKGKHVNLSDLAVVLGRVRSGLTILWHELAAEGLIAYPAEERLNNGRELAKPPPDLAQRIAAVREAKLAKRERRGKTTLTEAELEKLLP
jgi:hypothetical protein